MLPENLAFLKKIVLCIRYSSGITMCRGTCQKREKEMSYKYCTYTPTDSIIIRCICSKSFGYLVVFEEKDRQPRGDTGGSIYDGQQEVIYWSDVSSEVVFVVPSPTTFSSPSSNTTGKYQLPCFIPFSLYFKNTFVFCNMIRKGRRGF